jgi:DivIVA domain-containing protein
MDLLNLTFTTTRLRRGYKQQAVDDYLDLIAENLALPLAQRTLRPEEVRAVCFTATQFRDGYDEAEVDRVLDQLAVELGLPSPSEPRDAPRFPSDKL